MASKEATESIHPLISPTHSMGHSRVDISVNETPNENDIKDENRTYGLHIDREEHEDPTLNVGHRRSREAGFDSYKHLLDRIWALELLCVVISVASMVAVAALLAHLEGTSLEQWTISISPNTVVSILTTVIKTTMLAALATCFAQLRWCHYASSPRALSDLDTYDDAGRGALGSILLLVRMSFHKHSHTISRIACVGAILTGSAIVIDPSMQQILQYKTATVPSHGHQGAATMPISDGPSKGANILGDMQAWQALYGGFLGFEYPVPFECPTGNCTWPEFATLGICSDCYDALPTAEKQCLPAGGTDQSEGDDCTQFNYSMNDTNLVLGLKNGSQPVDSSSDTAKTYTMLRSVVSGGYPNGLSNSTLFEFLIAQLDVDFSSLKHPTFTPKWNLTQCSVRWCSRVYNDVRVMNGDILNPVPHVEEVYVTDTRACNGSICQQLVTNNSAAMPGGVNAHYPLILNPAVSNIPEILKFNYDVDAYANGTWDSSSVFSVTSTMFLNVDISAAIAKVCIAYTNRIRADGASSIVGTVLVTTTVIWIRWAWLVFPAIVVVCSAGFLVLVIVVTKQQQQYSRFLWKDSSLPLLCHPLINEKDGHMLRRLTTRSSMDAKMRRVYAQLRENDDGEIAFVAVNH